MTAPIGRIVLETADGIAHATALYNLPGLLREAELFTTFGIYRQQRQLASGQWVYRYLRPLGDRPVDHYLVDFRSPNDPEWDGPTAAPQPATIEQVHAKVNTLLLHSASNEGMVPATELVKLMALTHAAWHHLPYSE